jgi:hypothetical protein
MDRKLTLPFALLLGIGVTLTWPAIKLLAQTNPPPPSASKEVTSASGTASAPNSRPPSSIEGLKRDVDDQEALSEGDRQMERIRQQVFEVRQNAQRFQVARARLADIVAQGKCAGVQGVLKGLDREEADTRKLMDGLASNCLAEGVSGSNLSKICSDERRKLDEELTSYKRDRGVIAKMCPTLTN